MLRVRLFGQLDLRDGERTLPLPDPARARSLLAYLLLHRDAPQPRERLASLLWPESTQSQARTNLRHALHDLRRALPDPDAVLDVTPGTLRWRAPVELDVAAFERHLTEADTGDAAVALRRAVDLYTGDLLENVADDWVAGERDRLRGRYLGGLERLVDTLGRDDAAAAIPYADRLLREDPLREHAYRLLIGLHAARGDRARAVRAYHACAEVLERDLGVEPSAATRAAYRALLPDRDPGTDPAGAPFVGRAAERARLAGLWQDAERGRGGLVVVGGEPGVGKTRLVEEFARWCARRGGLVATARSYPAEGTLAYGAVVEWLRSDHLRDGVAARLGPAQRTELGRLLPGLAEGAEPDDVQDDGERRRRLFDALAHALAPRGAPLLLVADDLHLADRETLRFLHFLLRREPGARLLVAATARLEEVDDDHPLRDLLAGARALERCAELELARLGRDETGLLAARLAGHRVDGADADLLYAETEGNPLFLVETVRGGWAAGRAPARLSRRVQGVIGARLAQLSGPARDLAGLAATIGRSFTTDVLAGASDLDETDVVLALDELWRRRIVRDHGVDAYDFSHGKIREVAYDALGPAARRRHHARVAAALADGYERDPVSVSGQVAAHHAAGGDVAAAVTWYMRAGEAAQRVHAETTAVELLGRALDLLRTLPATRSRDERELAILTALPAPLTAVDGYASTRLIELQRRAVSLAAAVGAPPAAPLVRSVALVSLAQGDYAEATRLGQELLDQGRRAGDGGLVVEAGYVLGMTAFWDARFAAARAHLTDAVERHDPERARAHLLRFGQDPKVLCLARLGNTLWLLGDTAGAIASRDAALALADDVGHPYTSAGARIFAALLALDLDDVARFRHDAAPVVAAGRVEGAARQVRLVAEALTGHLEVLDGRPGGVTRIARLLEADQPVEHAPGVRAMVTRLLLAACVRAGDPRAVRDAAERLLAMDRGGRVWAAEARRLRAEAGAALGVPAEMTAAELREAMRVADRQGAPAWQRRVGESLRRHGPVRS